MHNPPNTHTVRPFLNDRLRALAIVGLAIGLAITFLVNPWAQAYHIGSYYSDDAFLSYKESFTGDEDTAFHDARLYEIDPTDINSWYWSGSVHSGGMADINAWPANLDPPLGGTWACSVTVSATVCKHGHLILDTDVASAALKAHLACHELGHAVGLSHISSGNSCLRDNSTSYTVLDWHDDGDINANY